MLFLPNIAIAGAIPEEIAGDTFFAMQAHAIIRGFVNFGQLFLIDANVIFNREIDLSTSPFS